MISPPSRDTLAKAASVLSLAVLALLYGYSARVFGWFPDDLLSRAWAQGRAVSRAQGPTYIHDRVYDREGARTVRPERVRPGLTLVTSSWMHEGKLTPGLRLIDRAGEVVHEWRVDPVEVFGTSPTRRRSLRKVDIQGSYLFPNGDVLVNLEYAGTARIDACGDVRWRLGAGNHHSIARDDDGSFWIPAVTSRARSGSPAHPDGFPGLQEAVFQDLLLNVAPDGTVRDTVNLLDVLYANGLERHIAEEDRLGDDDPTHLNDIEPLPDSLASGYPAFEGGDLLLSLRHLDMVLVLDPVSGRVEWHTTRHFIKQHDPDFLGDGWIGVFDNRWDGTDRGTMLGGSRIVALQPHTDSVKQLFPTPRSEPFYTNHRGKWQMLRGGRMLLTEEEAGRVVEVGPDGRTLWEWVVASWDGSRIASVTEGTRVDVTRDDVAGWPCAHEERP